jgi:ABC-type polysaccharide/polyol phosphate export permease
VWVPSLLPDNYQWTIAYNPFNHFLNLIRAPLMNYPLGMDTVIMVTAISIIGFFLYAYFFEKYQHRIVFWL